MKICVITDTHQGWRDDNPYFISLMKRFYDEVLFPCIDEYKITRILHLGDIVERRKYINFYTLHRLRHDFLDPCLERGIKIDLTLGNHDTYFKNTNEVNSPTELFLKWPNISVHTGPTQIQIGNLDIALVPWVCADNKEETFQFLRDTKAKVCMGHLELIGYEMERGRKSDHGYNAEVFEKFHSVASGHYHHKSSTDNIHYLGSPFQLTWADSGDLRGFHIFDTETLEFEFIANPFDVYRKFEYDDVQYTIEELLAFDPAQFKDKYIKVIIKNKVNPYAFDLVIEALESAGAAEITPVDDHFNYDKVKDEDILMEADDTMTSLRKYVDTLNFGVDKVALDKKINDLYYAAINGER